MFQAGASLSFESVTKLNFKRLTLIASDPRISAALLVLSVTKMILIYLNYRLWSVKLKDIYGEVLDTLVLDRHWKYTDQ